MGGSIGHGDKDLWKPYIMNDRQNHLSMVDTYLTSLPKGSSPSTIHSKKLAFMADNDIRQLGKPRIGIYADRVKPDPLHCEINAWQQILDLIYCESVRRCVFDKFIETLSAPIGLSSTNPPNGGISSEHNGSTVDVTGGVDSALECAADNHSVSDRGFVEDVGEGGLSHDSSLSPGMLRQFSVLELMKEAGSESMTSMLKTSTFTASNNIPIARMGVVWLTSQLSCKKTMMMNLSDSVLG